MSRILAILMGVILCATNVVAQYTPRTAALTYSNETFKFILSDDDLVAIKLANPEFFFGAAFTLMKLADDTYPGVLNLDTNTFGYDGTNLYVIDAGFMDWLSTNTYLDDSYSYTDGATNDLYTAVTNLGYLTSYTETDPLFIEWLDTNTLVGLRIIVSDTNTWHTGAQNASFATTWIATNTIYDDSTAYSTNWVTEQEYLPSTHTNKLVYTNTTITINNETHALDSDPTFLVNDPYLPVYNTAGDITTLGTTNTITLERSWGSELVYTAPNAHTLYIDFDNSTYPEAGSSILMLAVSNGVNPVAVNTNLVSFTDWDEITVATNAYTTLTFRLNYGTRVWRVIGDD